MREWRERGREGGGGVEGSGMERKREGEVLREWRERGREGGRGVERMERKREGGRERC